MLEKYEYNTSNGYTPVVETTDYAIAAKDFILLARKKYNMKLNGTAIIHLARALEKLEMVKESPQQFSEPLLWMLQACYREEYELATHIVKKMSVYSSVGYNRYQEFVIALLFIELQFHLTQKEALSMIELCNGILGVCANRLDGSLYNHMRFINHVKNLAYRIISKRIEHAENDLELFEFVVENYPKAYSSAQDIHRFVCEAYEVDLSNDEVLSLTIYLRNLIEQ